MSRLLLALCCFSLHAAFCQSAALPPHTRFVMSHFRANDGGGDERLYISHSQDGLAWSALNGGNPVWEPPGAWPFDNVVRDPTILFEGGFYWVAFTSGNYGRHPSFGLVKSADLLNWTFVGEIGTGFGGDPLTWNPVFFRDADGSIHVFISIAATHSGYTPIGMQIYEMHPLNTDFTLWSAPVRVPLPSGHCNEFWVWKEGAIYHAIYVDFPNNRQQTHVTSSQLLTGWGSPQVLGFATYEGAMILKNPAGGYRFFAEPGNIPGALGYGFHDLDANLSNPTPFQPLAMQVPMRNGKMTTAPATTRYGDWQARHLGTRPPAEQLPTADPDGDGRANLLECAQSFDPLTPDAARGPSPVMNGALIFTHRRLPSLSGISFQLLTADSALQWSAPVLTPRSITLLSDGTEFVETAVNVPFARLKATLSE